VHGRRYVKAVHTDESRFLSPVLTAIFAHPRSLHVSLPTAVTLLT
jgi:hypothetical protein